MKLYTAATMWTQAAMKKRQRKENGMKKGYSKKWLALVMTLVLCCMQYSPVIVMAQEEVSGFGEGYKSVHIHEDIGGDGCDNSLQSADLGTIGNSVAGEPPITTMDWPWTDCSNILGHDWGPWVSYYWEVTHPNPYCFKVTFYEDRVCNRTFCGKKEYRTSPQAGVNHTWKFSHFTTVNGVRYGNYTCANAFPQGGGKCGSTLSKPE
jgi:hypothetical protein